MIDGVFYTPSEPETSENVTLEYSKEIAREIGGFIMLEKMSSNIRLVAEGRVEQDGFDIYILAFGRKDYLMSHRKNDRMYALLKDGVRIGDLERSIQKVVSDISLSRRRYLRGGVNPRLKCKKNQARRLENSVGHLVKVAHEYMKDMTRAS